MNERIRNDGAAGWLESRVQSGETELIGLTMELEVNSAMASLANHHGWKALQEKLRPTLDNARMQMMTQRMDSYELGRRQGLIWGLSVLFKEDLLTDDEIESRKARIGQLRERIAEERAILA